MNDREQLKRERQRQHVKRSYYRKLAKVDGIRTLVRQLTEQHQDVLNRQIEMLELRSASEEGEAIERSSRQRAAQLYVEAAALKERLREENERLRTALNKKELLQIKIQNTRDEFNDSKLSIERIASIVAPRCPVSCIPMSLEECQLLVSSTYTVICSFMESQSYGTTGVSVFGFRDRHQIESDLLKFSLQKEITNQNSTYLIEQCWQIYTSPTLLPLLYPSSWDITIYPLQRVDPNNLIMYRLISSADRPVALESFFLLSRIQIERGCTFLFRSIDRSRMTRNEHDKSEKQWLDMHAWITIEEADDEQDSNFVFGGFVHTTSFAKCSAWMLEVLFIAMRWESRVAGPQFSIHSSD